MHLKRHQQMLHHKLVCSGTVSVPKSVQIISVFFHRSLNTAFHSQGILRREPDQIEKALENLIELIVFHISHQQKMKLVIRINKVFQLNSVFQGLFHIRRVCSRLCSSCRPFSVSICEATILVQKPSMAQRISILSFMSLSLSCRIIKPLLGINCNISILAQALERFSDRRTGYADLCRELGFGVKAVWFHFA